MTNLEMTSIIARACGWEVVESRSDGVKVDSERGTNWFLHFDNEADWFRAFDALGLAWMNLEKTSDGKWECEVEHMCAEHPDRLTAMGLALYAAARAKLGEAKP